MARHSVDIRAPAHEVYDLIADVQRRTSWLPELASAKAPARALQEGDRFDGVAALLGHRFLGTSEVLAAETGERLEERVVIGARFRTSWTITAAGDASCRVEHSVDVDFPGGILGRIERWVLQRRLGRLQRQALSRLRAVATTSGTSE